MPPHIGRRSGLRHDLDGIRIVSAKNTICRVAGALTEPRSWPCANESRYGFTKSTPVTIVTWPFHPPQFTPVPGWPPFQRTSPFHARETPGGTMIPREPPLLSGAHGV